MSSTTGKEPANMWQSILAEVSSSKMQEQKHLIVLGNRILLSLFFLCSYFVLALVLA